MGQSYSFGLEKYSSWLRSLDSAATVIFFHIRPHRSRCDSTTFVCFRSNFIHIHVIKWHKLTEKMHSSNRYMYCRIFITLLKS